MMNVLFTYTTSNGNGTAIKSTFWTTWEKACSMAKDMLLYTVGVSNISATWYDVETCMPCIKRKFYLGEDFITGKHVVLVRDIDY